MKLVITDKLVSSHIFIEICDCFLYGVYTKMVVYIVHITKSTKGACNTSSSSSPFILSHVKRRDIKSNAEQVQKTQVIYYI